MENIKFQDSFDYPILFALLMDSKTTLNKMTNEKETSELFISSVVFYLYFLREPLITLYGFMLL